MFKASYEREAVNTVFQGSASDLIKLSMNKIAKIIKDENLKAQIKKDLLKYCELDTFAMVKLVEKLKEFL